jgi:Type IIA topoisomerase (DNA gyrase/topo II, topoisomerase IV), A subunit
VIRTSADEVKQSGRQTMGVRLMNLAAGDSVVGLALNAESIAEAEEAEWPTPWIPQTRIRGPGSRRRGRGRSRVILRIV